MPVIRIDRFDDRRLDDYRHVSDAELLRRRNLFVAEGRHVVARAAETGHRVVSMLLNEASHRALAPVVAALAPDVPVYVCDAAGFGELTGFRLHRGCLALVERPPARDPFDVAGATNLLLVLDGIADADNVGSAFRNAAAFGASVLLSPTCCDPLYRKAVRTSMGGVLRVPYARLGRWPADLDRLRASGFTIVALTPRERATDLATFAPVPPRVALVAGSEGTGLSDAVERSADVCVRIETSPAVDSLNVATATGIALHSIARQVVIL